MLEICLVFLLVSLVLGSELVGSESRFPTFLLCASQCISARRCGGYGTIFRWLLLPSSSTGYLLRGFAISSKRTASRGTLWARHYSPPFGAPPCRVIATPQFFGDRSFR